MQTTDIETLLDEGRWSRYQKLICVTTAFIATLAAFDNQLSIQVLVSLASESPDSLSDYVGTSHWTLFGLVFGSWLGGIQADRMGRRTGLLANVQSLAAFTLLMSFVSGPLTFGIVRFLISISFGAAITNAAILTSEYVPRASRPVAVTLTILGLSIGALPGGFAVSWWPYGWRTLLVAAGGFSIIIALGLSRSCPSHRSCWFSRQPDGPN